ncbi:hypothetical protein AB1E18_007303 [Capra hircus]
MKLEGLSQEQLSTPYASAAYAAPELLAHQKNGPKVDVCSTRVNHKIPRSVPLQEVSQLQDDKNASEEHLTVGHKFQVDFVLLSGLPYRSCEFHDLTKHPDTEEAMRDKWLNEGSNGK